MRLSVFEVGPKCCLVVFEVSNDAVVGNAAVYIEVSDYAAKGIPNGSVKVLFVD